MVEESKLMNRQDFLGDLQARVMEVLRSSPAADVERNLKAMLGHTFQRLELVTREEFDLQRELLARARTRLGELEARVAQLEQLEQLGAAPPAPEPPGAVRAD